MIIECEACKSKFKLHEGLVKEKGTRVRCSLCKKTFLVFPPAPPGPAAPAEPEFAGITDEDMEETAALDGPLQPEGEFGQAFEAFMEEEDTAELISPDDLPEEEAADLAEAMERAARIEEEVTREQVEEEWEAPTAAVGEDKIAPQRKRPKSRRIGVIPIVAVLILVLMGGAAFLFMFAPNSLPGFLSFLKPVEKQETLDPGVARLTFEEVNGSFVQSDRSGQLFVIKGTVTNRYPKARSFILVKGAILDDKGRVVTRRMAYAGNLFTDKELNDISSEMINERSKNRFGQGKANANIKPGGAVPFMIVFENLPENLSEFTVEAVSSSPGS